MVTLNFLDNVKIRKNATLDCTYILFFYYKNLQKYCKNPDSENPESKINPRIWNPRIFMTMVTLNFLDNVKIRKNGTLDCTYILFFCYKNLQKYCKSPDSENPESKINPRIWNPRIYPFFLADSQRESESGQKNRHIASPSLYYVSTTLKLIFINTFFHFC